MPTNQGQPKTQLKRAIKAGDFDETRRLYAHGVEPDVQWIYDYIYDHKTERVRLLLELGISPAKANPAHSYNPAEYAIMQGRVESLQIMLELGLDPNALTQWGLVTLFQEALSSEDLGLITFEGEQECRTAMIDLLIEYGADLQALDDRGYGPVAKATPADGKPETDRARMLQSTGASTRGLAARQTVIRFHGDRSALGIDDLKDLEPEELSLLLPFLVARHDLIQAAIDLGADPNFPIDPPLISAAKGGKLDAVIALLEAGADVNIRDRDGNTPLSWAQSNGYEQVISLLRERGAKTLSRTPYPKRCGVSDIEGNVWSLCVKADADKVAKAINKVIDGKLIKDVLQQRHPVSKNNYIVVAQFTGNPWTHILARTDRRTLEKYIAEKTGLETLTLDCAKTASIAAYRYWQNGILADSLSDDGNLEFQSTLGTKKPRRSSRPEGIFDRAFKRFDAWAIETGLVSGPCKEGSLFSDIAYTNPKDFQGVHLILSASN